MAVSYIRPAGGLPAAAKALLTPDNIRAGVHIKGGGVDVVGSYLGPRTVGGSVFNNWSQWMGSGTDMRVTLDVTNANSAHCFLAYYGGSRLMGAEIAAINVFGTSVTVTSKTGISGSTRGIIYNVDVDCKEFKSLTVRMFVVNTGEGHSSDCNCVAGIVAGDGIPL